MSKAKKSGYAELEIITKGGEKTKFVTSCKLAFDIIENQKTRGVRIAKDSTETVAINYDDISLARAVVLKGAIPSIGYAEKTESQKKPHKPIYIPPSTKKEVGRL
ncbi:MAG: hypothetical protein E7200_05185 [Selenomonas ruminantium]|nr:hypothetical protein [Selenomonas ruminantium]